MGRIFKIAVNEIVDIFQGKINGITNIENVSLIFKAKVKANLLLPNILMNSVVGLIFSMMAGAGIAFL